MSEIFNHIFLFFLGTIFASFLNLLAYRSGKDSDWKGMLFGRSYCESCDKKLLWYELIPVFSFVFLRGRCSICNNKISVFNIFSELLLGGVFVFLFIFSFVLPFYIFIIVLYFWAVSDYYYQSIPKGITDVVFLISLFVWLLFLSFDFNISMIYPVILAFFIALMVWIASFRKKVFGVGDVIVIFILAFWSFSFDFLFFLNILLYSIIIGGIFSIFLVLKDRSYLKKYIPFLPFIFLGFLMALFLETRDFYLFDYIALMW